jgi:hypothetical protein
MAGHVSRPTGRTKSLERVKQFKYLGTTLTNQNSAFMTKLRADYSKGMPDIIPHRIFQFAIQTYKD